jgi:predicted glycogen debranching enzyme
MLQKNKTTLQNFNDAIQYEWLETNGLGGWSSSSIIHAHTRRYHGLLVAATKPPTERTVLLSKLDETIVVDDKRMELGCNLYTGDVISPNGNQFLKSFTKGLFPEWVYEAEGIQLKKTIAMLHGENTVVILYDVIKASKIFTLELLPLMAARFYHSLQHAGPQMHWDAGFENNTFHNQPDGNLNLYINVPNSSYRHTPRWFYNFKYSVEEYRGLEFTEDLFNHGIISVQLKKGDSIGIIISTENPAGRKAHQLFKKEKERREALLKEQPKDETIQQLILAADQFIVKRDIKLSESSQVHSSGESFERATIIAGYHWFTDWGRDTMISLPGLCLSTGRFEDAKKIIAAFAKTVSTGMLPNRFQDNGEEPEYNNVDGTLWYFIAVYKYLQTTNDKKFVLNEILPVLKEIIDWHFKGTRYNIHVDEDGLLFAGEKGQQLTWMDARIGAWVVTPRMGKPVEIQALWFNALSIYAALLKLNNEKDVAKEFELKSEKAKSSFNNLFWFDKGNYLYDVIDENGNADTTLRPNQLFAISLPFALIEGDKAKTVLKIVEEKLYTPVGLRSLPIDDEHYVHQYGGNQWHRDSSYHEGTVWSWLLGTYVDALVKVKSEKQKIKKVIESFKYHLTEGCIGSVSEIFDADAPHHPRGCIAQAWGVAEVLRVMKEYKLYAVKKKVAELDTV